MILYGLSLGRDSPQRTQRPQSLMSFAHPETMKMPLWGPFFLAKALRPQECTGLAPLGPSRLCERVPARRVAAIFRADERRDRRDTAPMAKAGYKYPPPRPAEGGMAQAYFLCVLRALCGDLPQKARGCFQ